MQTASWTRGLFTSLGITALSLSSALGATMAETHAVAASLCQAKETRVERITTFCVAPDGNLLVADGSKPQLLVIAPDDTLKATLPLPFSAGAIGCTADGQIYAGGDGRVVRLSMSGEVTGTWDATAAPKAAAAGTKETGPLSGLLAAFDADKEPAKRPRRQSKTVTGLACADDAVYVAMRGQTGYDVHCLSADLSEGKKIITKLRGCCGQMDIDALGNELVVAENSRHAVKIYDRAGKLQRQFGKTDRTCKNGFGSCCGPMNVTVVGDKILTGETVSPSALIKMFDGKGERIAVIGSAKGPASCSRMTLGATPDTATVYMLDGSKRPNVIRVFKKSAS